MNSHIILIGPVGAGKSTQAALLAAKLGLPHCPMDDRRWDYYREIGYSEETAKQIGESEGFVGIARYWKPFEAHAVERLLADQRAANPNGSVIDFGGGHSIYEDDALFARAQRALAPFPNVVLILPSPDPDESVRVLRGRTWDGMAGTFDFHEHFVKHHSNHDLARFVVYTKDKTPEETRDEIIALVRPVVRLELSLPDFDLEKWLPCVAECAASGIRFTSLAIEGDTGANRRRLYELNKECSADIPGRGPFYTFEEYCEKRLDVASFLPAGVILALDGGGAWVGMAAISHRPGQDYAFNEMTGVVRAYRRRGIATGLKVAAIAFARSLGVSTVRTVHAAANEAAIAMNLRLGYVPASVLPTG